MKALLIALGMAIAQAALAAYPDRPIKVLMPFPPGGTVDVVTRLVCNEASELPASRWCSTTGPVRRASSRARP